MMRAEKCEEQTELQTKVCSGLVCLFMREVTAQDEQRGQEPKLETGQLSQGIFFLSEKSGVKTSNH